MSVPAFSVVIPAYNEERRVGAAIGSVQAQTRADWEAIVVDDGSSDATAEVVAAIATRDPRVKLVSKPNAGLSAARNTAIKMARAPLVSLLDSDDLWLPGYLETMGHALEADPEAGIAYTDAWALDTESGRFRRATAMSSCSPPDVLPQDPVEVMKLLVRQNFIWVSVTARREALERAGLFRADLASAEDIELWFRVLAEGYRVIGPLGVLGIKGERADAMSRQDLRNVTNLQLVMGWVAENPKIPESVQELARAKIAGLERWRLALSGESRTLSLGLSARLRLGSVKRAILRGREWRSEPPAEVQAAFPNLRSVDLG